MSGFKKQVIGSFKTGFTVQVDKYEINTKASAME